MEPSTVGHVLLIIAVVACGAGAVTGRRWAAAIAGAAGGGAVAVLAWAFVTSDFRLRAVAEYSRRGASRPYRLSGLWAGTAPSLLFWSAISLALLAVGTRRVGAVRVGSTIAGIFTAASLLAADPFERLSLPPVDGTGLVPVLQHPAMLIHPPLLYLGSLATLPAFAAAFDGDRARARRWLAISSVVLTIALALGSWWAYAEQGWGGYWAWDPVENGGLLPWFAAVGGLHLRSTASARWHRLAGSVPFVLALAGTWLTRSGAAASVHAFGEARAVGWWLGVLTIAVLVAVVVRVVATTGSGERPRGLAGLQLLLTAITVAVVALGTFAPPARELLGGSRSATGGEFFARLLAPVAIVALVGAVIAALPKGRSRRAQRVAHVGFAVLLLGVAGSIASRSERVILAPDSTTLVFGHDVYYDRTTVTETENSFTTEARLIVDGVTLRPSLTQFGGRRDVGTGELSAETANSRRWWGDVQAVMVSHAPNGVAVFEIHRAPLQSLVWLGALVIAAGVALSISPRRRVSGGATVEALPSRPAEAERPEPS